MKVLKNGRGYLCYLVSQSRLQSLLYMEQVVVGILALVPHHYEQCIILLFIDKCL